MPTETPTLQNRPRPPALRRVTLAQFFRISGPGSLTKMASALDVSKGTLSALAAHDRPGAKSRKVFASLPLADAIQEYGKTLGFRIDTAPLLRRERGKS